MNAEGKVVRLSRGNLRILPNGLRRTKVFYVSDEASILLDGKAVYAEALLPGMTVVIEAEGINATKVTARSGPSPFDQNQTTGHTPLTNKYEVPRAFH